MVGVVATLDGGVGCWATGLLADETLLGEFIDLGEKAAGDFIS